MSDFVPRPENTTDKVQPGFFYLRPASSPAINMAEIARVANMRSSIPPTTAGFVLLIANSPWNRSHFIYAKTSSVQNYSAYGIEGPQYKKENGAYPPLWIPTGDGKEPEQVYGFAASPPTETGTVSSPGFAVSKHTTAAPTMSATPTASRTVSAGPGTTRDDGASGGFFESLFSPAGGGPPWGLIVAGGGLLVGIALFFASRKGKPPKGKSKKKGRSR